MKGNAKEELICLLNYFGLKFEGCECTREDGTIVNTTKLEDLDFEYDNEDKDGLNGTVYCTCRLRNGLIAPCWLTRGKYAGKWYIWETNNIPSFYIDENIKLFEQNMIDTEHQSEGEEINGIVNSDVKIKMNCLRKAFDIANDEGKKILQAIFPPLRDKIKVSPSITERVKTFEDACNEVGINPVQYISKYDGETADVIAYMKLKVICKALNEGWSPKFIEGEKYFQPSFLLLTEEELSESINNGVTKMSDTVGIPNNTGDYIIFVFTDSVCISSADLATNFSGALCLKDRNLANYCGRQFMSLWSDLKLAKN